MPSERKLAAFMSLGILASFLALVILHLACSRPSGREEGRPLRRGTENALAAVESLPSAVEYPLGFGPNPVLPLPFARSGVKIPIVTGWPLGKLPVAPAGFAVSMFADSLVSPRWLYVLPNGDVLVAQSSYTRKNLAEKLSPRDVTLLRRARQLRVSPDRITLLRDANHDGVVEFRSRFLDRLQQPFGMVLLGEHFYVANTQALVRYPYRPDRTKITAPAEKVLDLPEQRPNHHWTRNILAAPDGAKLYVAVGSSTDRDLHGVDAKDPRRAAILELDPDGTDVRVFASGLRNAVGMAWAPGTTTLWAVVNERQQLGDDLPPDFLTSIREGAFYGWPYAFYGPHPDPQRPNQRPDLVVRTVKPDYGLGAHTSPIGLVFYEHDSFPERFRGGAFISLHGSVARSAFSGYKVVFVPFEDGQPSGPAENFLTGFIASEEDSEVYGRPTGLAVLPDGSLLVADDGGDKIWRVERR